MSCGFDDDNREELSILDGGEMLSTDKPFANYEFIDDLSWLVQGPSVNTCALIVKNQERIIITILWVYLHKMIQEATIV